MPDLTAPDGSFPLHYAKWGNGPCTLLLFHGFGQDHGIFSVWSKWSERYTIYAFDIFYHGGSTRKDAPLTKQEWHHILLTFLEKEAIDRFSLGGFSLGGKLVLATSFLFPDRIDRMLLVAPDGIYQSGWYRLATSPFGRPLFRYLMQQPAIFDRWVDRAERLGVASTSLIKFARRELGPEENRLLVYRSWVYLDALIYSKSQIQAHLSQQHFEIHLVLGTQDRIIPRRPILKLLDHLENVKVSQPTLRHHQLIEPQFAEKYFRSFIATDTNCG